MKNLLKKLHIVSNNQSKDLEGSRKLSDGSSSPDRFSHQEHKPFSALSGWLYSVTNRHSPSPPSSTRGDSKIEQSDSISSSQLDVALDAVMRDSESNNSRDPNTEEYQIQLALEPSAREFLVKRRWPSDLVMGQNKDHKIIIKENEFVIKSGVKLMT